MKIVRSADRMRRLCRAARACGQTIGFVPTMGYLHEGHLSLVRRARRECGLVAASIFVNPLQFGPGEDYAAYPRSARRDHALLGAEGVDLLFEPLAREMYPPGFSTRVTVERLDENLCGRFRPGHFTGVATVVAKLLACCEPDRLYLGGKDYQQARILERMCADLNLGVRVVICPTVREPDGLAMSSRNVYLTPEERRWAPALHRALSATARKVRGAEIRTPEAASRHLARLLRGGPGRLQYAEAVDARELRAVRPLQGEVVLALACFLGRARLIDNVVVRIPGGRSRKAGAAPRAPGRKRGSAK